MDKASDSFPHKPIPSETIREGIMEWEKQLCSEVFSAFKDTYPDAEDFCTEYLRELAVSFRIASVKADVHQNISDTGRYKIYKDDYRFLERMLFELGIIGVEKIVESPLADIYNLAEFEPNRDGRLSPSKNCNLFVHPMFIHKIRFVGGKEVCQKPICPTYMASPSKDALFEEDWLECEQAQCETI